MIRRKLLLEPAMYVAKPGASEASTGLEKKPTMQLTLSAAWNPGIKTSSASGSTGSMYSGRIPSSDRSFDFCTVVEDLSY